MSLSAIDKKILNLIQGELPVLSQPFKTIARKIGITERRLLKRVKEFKENGIIMTHSAVLNYRKLGYKSTLLALKIPEDKLNSIINYLIKFKAVTHCFLRKGEYNLWVVFIYRQQELKKVLHKLSKEIGSDNILNLETLKQFKLSTSLRI